MFGYQGKFLRVDLSKEKTNIEEIDPELYLNFLGGRGLGVKIFSSEVSPDVAPLSPENKIVIATGPLTGTGTSSGCICSIVTKSSLTKTIISAQGKLFFGAELKASGYDGIIIEGKAKEPSFLLIKDQKVQILPAKYLSETNTDQTETLIRSTINDPWVARETRILSIGPAGERLFPLAALVTEGCLVQNSVGIGAVFGSKNLKTIVVRGTKDVVIHDKELFFKAVVNSIDEFSQSESSKAFSDSSTYVVFEEFLNNDILSASYFTQSPNHISLSQIKSYWQRHRGCFSCPVSCLKAKENGAFLPDIDALWALGPLSGIYDLKTIITAYDICIKMGLDPVETGLTLACLMSLKERGLLEKEELKIKLQFGNEEAFLDILTSIIVKEKEPLLGKGAFGICQYFDKPDLFIGVKSRSAPFDVQSYWPLGLQYATSTCGATHLTGFIFLKGITKNTEDIVSQVKLVQDKTAVLEALGICPYALGSFSLENLLSMFQGATGVILTVEDLLKIGETIYQLEHEFNQNVGIGLEADNLPKRWLFPKFQSLLKDYHQLRGWQ